MKRLFQWLANQEHYVPSQIIFELSELLENYQALSNKTGNQQVKVEKILTDNHQMGLLHTIPGVGPIIASACISSVYKPADFKNGRNFAALIGLVPVQYSTGGKTTMMGISKRGESRAENTIHSCCSLHFVERKICREVLWKLAYQLQAEKAFQCCSRCTSK